MATQSELATARSEVDTVRALLQSAQRANDDLRNDYTQLTHTVTKSEKANRKLTELRAQEEKQKKELKQQYAALEKENSERISA
jgi:ketosteroid isomerase-like protein